MMIPMMSPLGPGLGLINMVIATKSVSIERAHC